MDKKIIRLSATPTGFGQTPDALEGEMFVSESPVQHTHLYYEDEDQGLYVGVWDTTDMIETAGPYACDEFMWLLEGEVEIKNSKTSAITKVQAGEAFVIPRGYDCQWQQTGYLRKFFVISEHPDEIVPTVPVVEDIVNLGSAVAPKNEICYRNSTARFIAGCWQRDPFKSEVADFPGHQFAYVLAGSVELKDQDGEAHTFAAGDAFFAPRRAVCRWHSTGGFRAFYTTVKTVGE